MPVKAGDAAPNLRWTKTVASAPSPGVPQNFRGYTTALFFLRPVSVNAQTLSTWNKLVEQFADKPVNFIWVANEPEESLAPFLKDHPVRGWMLLDPQEDSYKAYGVEGSDLVLIDSDGIIAGFAFLSPQGEQIQAVLDGRAIAMRGEPTEAQMEALFQGKVVRLEAEPRRMPGPQRPDLPAPSDEVRISLSQTQGTNSSSGPDHWMRRGFILKATLAELLDTSPTRVDLPPALDNETRYDFVFVPLHEEDLAAAKPRVQEAIEKFFHVTIKQEVRFTDVYVMTAIEGKTPPPKSETESFGGSFITSSSSVVRIPGPTPASWKEMQEFTKSPEFLQAMAKVQLASIAASNTSVEDFRRALEDRLHRPVIDETKLTGTYDFQVEGDAPTTEEFLALLRDQAGLLLTPASRSIDFVVVRPVN
jgi:uncharacterized protein (TIGR03435 family)